jgi:hypothetical protein
MMRIGVKMATEMMYTVACCTPGCNWEKECRVQDDARLAGEQHEREHDGHLAYLFPPDMTQEAA